MQKVRTGSKGVYGPIPMPPSAPDKISDADLKTAIDWILTL
jgi:cytochrome c